MTNAEGQPSGWGSSDAAADWSGGKNGGQAGEGEDDGPVGPFPSWKAVYTTVVVYGVLLIGILLALTRALSFS